MIDVEKDQSATCALLSLYIDGKTLLNEDLYDSFKSLEKQDDITLLIEELYLISLYSFLSNVDYKTKIAKVLKKIDREKTVLTSSLKDTVLLHKVMLIKSLNGQEITCNQSARNCAKLSNFSDVENLTLLGSLCFLVGIFAKNESCFHQGKEVADLVSSGLNKEATIDCFFLFTEGNYDKDSSRISLYTLLSLYTRIYGSRHQELLDKLDPYQGGLFQSVVVGGKLLLRVLDDISTYDHPIIKENAPELNQFISINTSGFSVKSVKEEKVGIASVSFQDETFIPSFGPHINPLGRAQYYGLAKPIANNMEVAGTKLSMWNRVKEDTSYGNHWIHTSMECMEEKCTLETFLFNGSLLNEISFVLFIKASKMEVENKVYESGGLLRQSCETNKICLQLKKNKVQIVTKKSVPIEIIPLAGQDHYWNSDFIIAYSFKDKDLLRFEFIVD